MRHGILKHVMRRGAAFCWDGTGGSMCRLSVQCPFELLGASLQQHLRGGGLCLCTHVGTAPRALPMCVYTRNLHVK